MKEKPDFTKLEEYLLEIEGAEEVAEILDEVRIEYLEMSLSMEKDKCCSAPTNAIYYSQTLGDLSKAIRATYKKNIT